ncbi:LysR family transcriptional regulator [Xinfangfangia sp. D13-10-4-6]|uniref:LysR family transcriptional regulator n=1 Tax=Pseudogemmobacter hezensis TaxID=2737662 RepID=UPI001553A152|nr:LysR family transcriptional regulator [Pseudogemmobacter hezensis]NPD17008.1 LysR family transcriptional regulator [Pseudogemmobacter hezensis]
MLIRHLDFFVTLAEEAHFGRAAELCGVSQPALSLAIRKLEDDLGTPLILRGQRFLGLTAEGEKVLLWGRQILSDYGNLRSDLSGRRKGGLTGELRLGVSPAAIPLLPLFCEQFEAKNPLSRLRIETMPLAQIETALADFTLDGGLGWLPAKRAKSDPLRQQPLWNVTLKFACRADHPFAQGGAISLGDAATQPLCLIGDLPLPVAVTGRPAILCAGLDAVLGHLRHGGWCSLVPDTLTPLLHADDDICLIPLSDAPPAPQIGGMVLRREPQSPMVRAFDDCLATLAGEQAARGAAA